MHYLVVDFEMSGDDPTWHEIIQVGAVLYSEDWRELGRYSSNVYPENEEAFSRPSEEIHGLSLEELKDAPMMNEILPEFEEWIVRKMGKQPDPLDNSRFLKHIMLAGLGLVNDYAFFRAAYRYENRRWPFSYRMLDMQSITHSIFPVLRRAGVDAPTRQSLEAIAAFFGLEREGFDHNALEDAALTGRCFIKLMKLADKMEYKG
jgi:DNA polymerase III subunit epsilon